MNRTDPSDEPASPLAPSAAPAHPLAEQPSAGTGSTPRPVPGGRGPSRWLAALLGALVMAAGVGVGWLIGNDAGGDGPVSTTTAATVLAPTLEPGEEPVAAVAAALLPSMVQIENGFGLGSGFVYQEDLVLTAAHVVEGSNQVTVRFADGNQAQGTILGSDTAHDVAVIGVETGDTAPAPLALDSEPVVGQLAVALGSPWGLEQTVTSGVVSAVDRPIADATSAQVLIQTDASINPGNSGGALADRRGRVIGVNVEIFTLTGSSSGVGFAVPIDVAYAIAGEIVAGTPIETAYLGVTGENAAGEQAGAVITELVEEGPAAAAGLEVGDLVTAVDAQSVRSMGDLAARIRSYRPGDEVVLDVLRDGQTLHLTITLGTRPGD
ncbi:MAG TPA: trypsin-like peptidase domain-containing protein [Acidimicrobiia bacterium]|nr:trypsin-like peptidase domain-containing protein [Acidimicrobiia bacterium]